jgi:hypothetical protein
VKAENSGCKCEVAAEDGCEGGKQLGMLDGG